MKSQHSPSRYLDLQRQYIYKQSKRKTFTDSLPLKRTTSNRKKHSPIPFHSKEPHQKEKHSPIPFHSKEPHQTEKNIHRFPSTQKNHIKQKTKTFTDSLPLKRTTSNRKNIHRFPSTQKNHIKQKKHSPIPFHSKEQHQTEKTFTDSTQKNHTLSQTCTTLDNTILLRWSVNSDY